MFIQQLRSYEINESIVETNAHHKNKLFLNAFCFLQSEIPKHLDDTALSFLEDLLLWSLNLP